MTPKEVRARSLRSGFTWLLAAEGIIRLLSAAVAIIAARIVGPAALGDYVVALSLLAYATVLGDAGLTIYAQREIAKHAGSAQTQSTISATLLIQLAFCVVAAAIIASAALLLPISPGAKRIAWLGLPLLLAQAMSLLYVVQAYERMAALALLRTLNQIVASIGGVVAIIITDDIAALVIATWVTLLGVDAVCWFILRQQQVALVGISRDLFIRTARAGLPYLLNALLVTLLLNLDVLFVGMLSNSEQAGLYGAAYRTALFLLSISGVVMAAIFPRLVRLWQVDREQFRLLIARVITLALRFTLPITAVVVTCSDYVVSSLYGPSFRESSDVLRVLFLWVPLGWISTFAGQALLASGNYRKQLQVACGSACVMAPLLWVLVLPFGAVGAAWAVALSEIATFVGFVLVTRKTLGLRLEVIVATEWPYFIVPISAMVFAQQAFEALAIPVGLLLTLLGLLLVEKGRDPSTWRLCSAEDPRDRV